MPKSSPEKLAKALRANLKKRKSSPGLSQGVATPEPPAAQAESRPTPKGPDSGQNAPERRPGKVPPGGFP